MKYAKSQQTGLLGAGIVASIASSLCCIVPAAALIAGMSGAASAVSWIEPLRPYLLGFAGLSLGFAWYQKLKLAQKQEANCDRCEDESPSSAKIPFLRSKTFLTIVTVVALLMGGFPYYSGLIYTAGAQQVEQQDEYAVADTLTLQVDGMTCNGCEKHIEHALGELTSVVHAKASYKAGRVQVINQNPDSAKIGRIQMAIRQAGYSPKGLLQPEKN